MDIKKLFIEELNYNPAFAPLAIPDVSDKEKIIDIQIAFEKQGFNIILVRLRNLILTLEKEIIKKLKKDYPDSAFLITDANESVINLYTIKLTEDKKEKIKKLTYDTLNEKTRLFKEKIRFFEVSEDITGRLSLKEKIEKAFDTEKVTKKFFTEFQKYHDLFLKFIMGIPIENDRKWYASVLLNRLMFIYFIQKKGFIDNNPDYLKDKFEQIKAKGKNYYKDFLLPLFFNGFAKKDSAFQQEFGKVPYLNGGLFLPHEIERKYSKPEYAKAPDQLFTYADMIQEGELLTKEAFEKNEINIQSVQITIDVGNNLN